MNRKNESFVSPVRHGERGQSLILMAALLVGLLSMAALVIDLGNVYFSYRELQASSDAAALAGAQDLPNATATATAQTYSSKTGQKNAQFNLHNVTESATLECLTTTKVPCLPPANMNAIQVTETAVVNTFFAKLFGVNSITVSATATASAKSGNFGPFNVMMIADNTPSMSQNDTGCTLAAPNNTKIGCALAGLRTLAQTLSPCSPTLTICNSGFVPVDEIGLDVFPQLANNSANLATDTDCVAPPTTGAPVTQFVNYANLGGTYQVIPFTADFRNSDTQGLNTGSNLSKSVGGGVSGCAPLSVEPNSQGIDTYYAAAINAAQAQLVNFQSSASPSRADSTNVIILLSDGDANAPSSQMPAGNQPTGVPTAYDQCKQAIAAAAAAKAAGTWVYAIAYGASTSSAGSCSTDRPSRFGGPGGTGAIAACSAMQQIASDPTKFFSDTTTQGADPGCVSAARPITDLNTIFAAIAGDFTNARLIPNNTQ